jgi:hypothetical protein
VFILTKRLQISAAQSIPQLKYLSRDHQFLNLKDNLPGLTRSRPEPLATNDATTTTDRCLHALHRPLRLFAWKLVKILTGRLYLASPARLVLLPPKSIRLWR